MTSQVLRWHVHLDVWLLVAFVAGGYILALRHRRRRTGNSGATRNQKILFGLGVVAMWVAADWPVHDVAERSLYSVHMIQHMLLSLVMPPLILLGTPAWMFRAVMLRTRIAAKIVTTLCRPLIALVLFNVVLVLTHWPAVVTLAVQNEPFHLATHTVLVLAAFCMWMPVASPVLEVPRLSYPGQMLYLFLQSLVPNVPAAFLTFGTAPLYHVYEQLPRLWGIGALTDQRTAGLIMKLLGTAIFWAIGTVLFFKWYRLEHTTGIDALGFRDVQRDLNRMEL